MKNNGFTIIELIVILALIGFILCCISICTTGCLPPEDKPEFQPVTLVVGEVQNIVYHQSSSWATHTFTEIHMQTGETVTCLWLLDNPFPTGTRVAVMQTSESGCCKIQKMDE